jgi:hypothetical protein
MALSRDRLASSVFPSAMAALTSLIALLALVLYAIFRNLRALLCLSRLIADLWVATPFPPEDSR